MGVNWLGNMPKTEEGRRWAMNENRSVQNKEVVGGNTAGGASVSERNRQQATTAGVVKKQGTRGSRIGSVKFGKDGCGY